MAPSWERARRKVVGPADVESVEGIEDSAGWRDKASDILARVDDSHARSSDTGIQYERRPVCTD